MTQAIVFDTETTGQKEPVIVEAAWLAVTKLPKSVQIDDIYCQRFNPGKHSEYGALATHHILNEDLIGMPPSSSFALPQGLEYMIGHNVDYDWEVAGKPNVKRICTLALARMAWPDTDSHKQSALIYMILDPYDARRTVQEAHSAAADVQMCLTILDEALHVIGGEYPDWESVWQLSEQARIPTKITFGEHAGKRIEDIPVSYRQWILKKKDGMDPYLVKAVMSSLGMKALA